MNKKGFTLIEMLVVVFLVGILSAVALPNYRRVVEKSKTAEAAITSKTILDAAMIYAAAYRHCPSSLSELDVKVSAHGKYWDFKVDSYGNTYTRNCYVEISSREKELVIHRGYVGTAGANGLPVPLEKGSMFWVPVTGDSTDFFQAIQATVEDDGTVKWYR